jgi:hypothetical protein
MPRKKKLLSRIPKDSREEINRIMDECDGELPLHDFLTHRWETARPNWTWDFMEHERSKEAAHSDFAERYPQLSASEVDLAASFNNVRLDLVATGIARRIVLEDPQELALRLAIAIQLDAHFHQWEPLDGVSPTGALHCCAARNFDAARQLVEGNRAGMRAFPDHEQVLEIAMTAALLRDLTTLKTVTSLMTDVRMAGWEEGLADCLTGVAQHNPTQVAAGLNRFLQTIHKMQLRPELDGAVNLEAQGLFRLIESISPGLVAEFDVSQDFPWDAGFHRWFDEHPEPLAGLDLTGIAPELHDAVVLGNRPKWMVPAAREKRFEVILTGIPRNPTAELCKEIGRCAGMKGTKKEIAALMEYAPVVIFWGLTEDFAHKVRDRIAMFGGTAEVRELAPTVYRLFTSEGGKLTAW